MRRLLPGIDQIIFKGAIGTIFCENALREGHSLTILVRNADKVSESLTGSEQVTMVQGSLEDDLAIEKAVKNGASLFVSFAGPAMVKATGTVRIQR